MGDGFMLAFSSARRALQCAVSIQQSFEHHEPSQEPIRVRMGLHTGEAIKDADDFYGRNVILASRVADQAVGGEILVSSLLKELVDPTHVETTQQTGKARQPSKEQRRGTLGFVGIAHFSCGLLASPF